MVVHVWDNNNFYTSKEGITMQLSFNDIEQSKSLTLQPVRTAFIDECGNFGFAFEKQGTSLYYIVCAVIIKDKQIKQMESAINELCRINFGNGEMKSKSIGKNHSRRFKICTELLMLDFSLIILIADKQAFYHDSPLANHRDPFVKYLHQKLYEEMYATYPKLKIIEDEYASSKFQSSYREYVRTHRPQLNLFNEYDFDYVNSKHSPIVQIADFVAGSIMQHLLDNKSPDVLKIFHGRIRGIIHFPNVYTPFFASTDTDNKYDSNIYELAYQCAISYIDNNYDTEDDDIRLRVLFLRHLLFVVRNISASKYVSSVEIANILSDLSDKKVNRDYLYRKIIAPLRDAGVIIASCSHGYKIPTCIDDIISYVNQSNSIVGPMLNRVEICRTLVFKQTDGALDIFDDPALLKYKRYFGDY